MATVRELTWKIGWQISDSPIRQADKQTDQLDKKVQNLGRNTEKIDKSAKIGFGGMFSAIKQGIGIFAGFNIGSTITNAFTGGIKAGWDFNSSMEQSTAAFETLLGSTSKAKSMLSDLNNFAAKTPFELDDLTKASQTLLAFGIDANKVMPDLKMLGDVSLGNKEKFDSLTLAFAQVQATGRLTGQDLLQMVNAGFNPLQIISEKTGISLGDLKKAMEDGAISADMVTQAFRDATSAGGRFYKGLEKQSQTFEGQMSTLRDNIKQTFGNVMKPMFDYATNTLLPRLNEKVGLFQSELQKTGSPLQAIKEIIKSTFGGDALNTFNIFSGMVSQVSDFVQTKLFPIFSNIFGFITQDLIPRLGAAFQQWFPYIMNTLNNLADIFNSVFPTIKNVVMLAINDIIPILSGLVKAFDGVIEFITGVFTGNWEKALEGIKNIFSGIWDAIKGIFKWTLDAFLNDINMVIGLINKIPGIEIPKIPIEQYNIPTNNIPHYASGVMNFRGGPAWINDGPGGGELAIMPSGSTVIPADKTNKILSGAGGNTYSPQITVQVTVQGGNSPEQTGNVVASTTKKAVKEALEEIFYELSIKSPTVVEY